MVAERVYSKSLSEISIDRQKIYIDKTLNKSDLSAETLEWLEWFNGLSETGQLSVSFVPHEILKLCGYVSTENSEVSGPED